MTIPGLPQGGNLDQINTRLLGCDWGYIVALAEDNAPCDARATTRMELHGNQVRFLVQLCPTHAATVTAHTETHRRAPQPATT